MVVGSAEAVTTAELMDVGLMGTPPLTALDVVVAGQNCAPHSRSVGQQPPPWLAGHDR